jgi:fructose-specific phosphotransferase system component IIB
MNKKEKKKKIKIEKNGSRGTARGLAPKATTTAAL